MQNPKKENQRVIVTKTGVLSAHVGAHEYARLVMLMTAMLENYYCAHD